MYNVQIEKNAIKTLKKLPKNEQIKIIKKLKLLKNPKLISNNIKSLSRPLEGYRLRIGKYRALYTKNTKTKLIRIYLIRHRKDVY